MAPQRSLSGKHFLRVQRRGLASAAQLRLHLARLAITGRSSEEDVEREAERAVKDLLELAGHAYPRAPADLMGAIARSLLVDALSQRRRDQSRGVAPTPV
jgi:hypothetical protein